MTTVIKQAKKDNMLFTVETDRDGAFIFSAGIACGDRYNTIETKEYRTRAAALAKFRKETK